MLAFGRPRALLVAAGAVLVAAGMAAGPEAPATPTSAAVPRTTTTLDGPTSTTVPRSRTTATPTTSLPGASTSTTEAGDEEASTTTTTSATTTTSGRARPTSTTTTAAPRPTTTSTAAAPCPTGQVVWSADFAVTPKEEERWEIKTSGTLANDTGASVEITSVTTFVSVSDGTTEVRAKPSPRELGPGGRGTFAGETTVESSSQPSYRSSAVTARWADESIRARCPAPG